jgi:hypothetical protein
VLARSGLTFSELCALYYSRALIECFAGTHVLADVQSALDKFEAALSPQMKKFLDRLPGVVTAKPRGAKKHDATTHEVIAKLLEAILHQRVVVMRYYSQANRREKDYTVHPHRLVHAQGGLYLWAFVPAFGELRTFAVERIKRASLQEQTFTPIAELDADPFKHSMGAYRGAGAATSRIQIRFHPRLAPYHQGALVAPVAAAQGSGGRLGPADDGGVRRLHAPELDSQLRTRGSGAGAGVAGRLYLGGAGAGGAPVRGRRSAAIVRR